ncbi:MAG: MBL fold metallo-hydrolase [bacterium]
MKIRKLAENVYYLAGPFFVFYVVTGTEKVALIELGISQLVPQILHDIKEGLAGRAPDILIAPHGHFDHAGSSARWRKELPAAILCASAPAAKMLSDEKNLAPYIRSMKSFSDTPFFNQVFPMAETEPFIAPVYFDRILKEGDKIELGGETLEVFETPGHSACSISLFHVNSRSLFCSDACGMPLTSGRIWPSAFFDKNLYLNSISKMAGIAPKHICTGHNPPMSGEERNQRYLAKNIEATDNFFARIEALWSEHGDKEAVQKALFADYKNEGAQLLAFVFKYGNKEMVRQVADGVQGRG